MIYNNYRFVIIFRIILISATIYLSCYLFIKSSLLLTPIFLVTVVFYLIYSLFSYIDKSNRLLASFFQSIRNFDFTQSFQVDGLGKSYQDLLHSFNSVINDFQQIRKEREKHSLYFHNVIQHIGIGLIAFSEDGSIQFMNNAAHRIFNMNPSANLSNLYNNNLEFFNILTHMTSGEKRLYNFQSLGEKQELIVHCTKFKLLSRNIILVSMQNIKTELSDKEISSWFQLIQVLSHEIMNSIAPISSLSETANDILSDFQNDSIDDRNLIDLKEALYTIKTRCKGLLKFVKSYRSLTYITDPEIKKVSLSSLFNRIKTIMRDTLNSHNIILRTTITPTHLSISIDERLIEQVLINLINNSISALSECKNPAITLSAKLKDHNKPVIQIIDNGQGIIPENFDKIFLPFYSTKSSSSGIGLSLSRQIMRLHNGDIDVSSKPNKSTTFTLYF